MAIKNKKEVILVFGDTHFPYSHEDTIEFLSTIKKKYNPTKVICTGDEIDNHSISYHEHDPDLYSPGVELIKARDKMKQLYNLFPIVNIVDSNHGSLIFRKRKTAGLPLEVIKPMKEILHAPKGWNWHPYYRYRMINGQTLYVVHGQKKNVLTLAKQYGCCVAQGHFHTESNISYSSSPDKLIWGASVGCLIDDKSLSMMYNKVIADRPILSCLLITDGIPIIIPMVIKNHRWIGKI